MSDYTPKLVKSKLTPKYAWVITILVILIIALASLCIFLYLHFSQVGNSNSSQVPVLTGNDKVKADIQTWVSNPDKPTNPQIVEIKNADDIKSKNPALYAEVQNGDLLVLYPHKLVIYRPSTSKIVLAFPSV